MSCSDRIPVHIPGECVPIPNQPVPDEVLAMFMYRDGNMIEFQVGDSIWRIETKNIPADVSKLKYGQMVTLKVK